MKSFAKALFPKNNHLSSPASLYIRVSQFRFKKSFPFKQNLVKQKQFRFVSLCFASVSRNHKKKFCFVSLRFAS